MKTVTIYTDGACKGNPGPGGWAAILIYGPNVREISGGAPATTNNRMEIHAAIEALGALKEPCKVELYTDSAYLRNGVVKWVEKWRARGWVTNGSAPVRNQDLWKALDEVQSPHSIIWHWLKGHGGNPHNIRCDRLAKLEIANVNRSHSQAELKTHLSSFFADHGRRAPHRQSNTSVDSNGRVG